MSGTDYFDISAEFAGDSLQEADVLPGALEQLERWIREAIASSEAYPTAMHLATSTFEGKPSVRVVLLRRIDEQGLYFLTNFESKKGKQILQNPFAAAEFFWSNLERQVRLEGTIVRVDDSESDKWFTRCTESARLSAWAFPQSQVVQSRKYLETLLTDFREEFSNKGMERPANWGGYCLRPQLVEFWQGRPNGVHDRLQYTLFNGEWTVERLAP